MDDIARLGRDEFGAVWLPHDYDCTSTTNARNKWREWHRSSQLKPLERSKDGIQPSIGSCIFSAIDESFEAFVPVFLWGAKEGSRQFAPSSN